MPTIITRGAASAQALGFGSSSAVVPYIEDVFSTYLYTGNGSTQTITNGIDLSGKGGLVWNKDRNNANGHILVDSAVGLTKYRKTESTAADSTTTAWIFNSNGYVIPVPFGNIDNQVSWTFRKQPKFFDIVTYTGTGANRTIAHSLGSVPGMIIVKRTDAVSAWQVYHRSLAASQYMVLNTTGVVASGVTRWNNTAPTSSVFSIGTDTTVNASGGTYVAYLFAHDAGGFGLTGTDNVISCGTFTTDGSGNATVSLGYEPQWAMMKDVNVADGLGWFMFDNMRGIPGTGTGSITARLLANSAAVENPNTGDMKVTATGFVASLNASRTYIYIAIRRGPMKVPTSGTSVFTPAFRNATLPGYTSNFPVDWATRMYRPGGASQKVGTRLLGGTSLQTNTTSAAASDSEMTWDYMSGWGNDAGATSDLVSHMFRRAPGFFDVVCYTGTGTYPFTINHNLGVAPELMIFKKRDVVDSWWTFAAPITSPRAAWYQNYVALNSTVAALADATSITTAPTSTTVPIAAYYGSANTWSLYLFASISGVSKVGSYTGNGTTQTINCGFAAGARFVLIKRTDAVGDWYVYDTARGMTALTDPYLLLNSTAAEVATLGSVTTVSTGFALNSAILAAINVNASKYIFLAIA